MLQRFSSMSDKKSDIKRLKSEKRKLESDLHTLNETSRQTRLQSLHGHKISEKSKHKIEARIKEINELLIKSNQTTNVLTITTTSVTTSTPFTSAFVNINPLNPVAQLQSSVSNDNLVTEKDSEHPKIIISSNETISDINKSSTNDNTIASNTNPLPITSSMDNPSNFQAPSYSNEKSTNILGLEYFTEQTTASSLPKPMDLLEIQQQRDQLLADNARFRRQLTAEKEAHSEEIRSLLHEQSLKDIENLDLGTLDASNLATNYYTGTKKKTNTLNTNIVNTSEKDTPSRFPSANAPLTSIPIRTNTSNVASNYNSQTSQIQQTPIQLTEREHLSSQINFNTNAPYQINMSSSTPKYTNINRLTLPPTHKTQLEYIPLYSNANPIRNFPYQNKPNTNDIEDHFQTAYNIPSNSPENNTHSNTHYQSNPIIQNQTKNVNFEPNLKDPRIHQFLQANQTQTIKNVPQPINQFQYPYSSQQQQLIQQSQIPSLVLHPNFPRSIQQTFQPYQYFETQNTQDNQFNNNNHIYSQQFIEVPQQYLPPKSQQTIPQQQSHIPQHISNMLSDTQLQQLAQMIVNQTQQNGNFTNNKFVNNDSCGQSNYRSTTEKPRDSYIRRLRLLPIFDGESFKQLRDFLEIAQSLNDSYSNDAEKEEFNETLNLQLRGEARDIIGNTHNTNFHDLKNVLLRHFSYLNNRDIITSQLENLRQERNESISAYADRTRKLLKQKNSIYNHLTEDQRLEHNRTARKHFSLGISDSKLRDRLLIRGANNLEDAIAYAIEAENDLISIIPNSELYCKFCKIGGSHRERDCRKKENSQGGFGQLINALRNLNKDVSGSNQSNQYRTNNYNQNSYNSYRPPNNGPNQNRSNQINRNNNQFSRINQSNQNNGQSQNRDQNRNWNNDRKPNHAFNIDYPQDYDIQDYNNQDYEQSNNDEINHSEN